MFATRQVEKTYLAVVRGYPAESGVIDHPLSRPTDAAARPGAGPDAPPQSAVTGFRRLATVELPYRVDRYPTSRYALLALQPRTGRRHQLRRHLKHLSHPIIGDTTYGKGRHNHLFDTLFGCRRLLLACIELRLTHPVTAHPLVLTAPLEADFARVIQQLGWRKADVPGADFTNVLSGHVNLTRVVI